MLIPSYAWRRGSLSKNMSITSPFNTRLPVLGFVAPSGTGKTTLLTTLITLFKQSGIRVGVIKHSHHDFEIDKPGKDSYELRTAGAKQMLIASKYRWALINENAADDKEPELSHLLDRLDQTSLDLILVEGFKHEDYPKISLFRSGLGQMLIDASDANIIAVATDAVHEFDDKIPCLDLNDPGQIFRFILQHFSLSPHNKPERDHV